MFVSTISALNVQTILIGLVVILVTYKLIQRLKNKEPPGPWALPLIGNYEVIAAKSMFEKLNEIGKKYGPVFKIYLGPFKTIILNDFNVVTEALIKRKADFAGRPYIATVYEMTNGNKDIAFANYTPTWKLHRKIAGKALRQYMSGRQLEKAVHDSLSKTLSKMAEETGPFDPVPHIDLLVYNILSAVCFGESYELEDQEFQWFRKINSDIVDVAGKGFVEDLFPFLLKVWPTKKYKTVIKMVEDITGFLRKKFNDHRASFDPDNLRDLTDAIILARKEAEDEDDQELLSSLTDTHLVQTLSDVFGAGIDTSRLTLYFAVRYMAGLQDIQSKVHEELDRVVGKERLPVLTDRENLGYGEATLREVMRLGTAVPGGVPHMTLCDTQVGGYDVPKGTAVMINHWALHRDPNYWKDVDTFDPTRFLDENGKLGMTPESWLPFSAGRRVCLGEAVAKPELHLILCSILQRFKITLPDGVDPGVEVTCDGAGLMQPVPFKIIVQERR